MGEQYPNLTPYAYTNGHSSFGGAKNSVMNGAQTTMDNVKNSSTVQSLANGPVADKARAEADNTKIEFSNLAAARHTPSHQTVTGQNLTHYHSFFYHLLSWENPRATAITYAMIVATILFTRYFPTSRYALKILYTVTGLTAAAEIAGKLVLGQGLSSKMRPKKYYTIPRETLESMVVDASELANFFVIEFQRIVFAENVYTTLAAFATAFVTYFLIKFMPHWGLALLFTTVAFFGPLLYMENQEVIDQQIANAQNLVSEQAGQVRDLAAQHTNKAVEMSQVTFKEYSAKAQDLIGQTKRAAVNKNIVTPETADKIVPESIIKKEPEVVIKQEPELQIEPEPESSVKSEDFPAAPRTAPTHSEDLPVHFETSSAPVDPVNTREGEPLLSG